MKVAIIGRSKLLYDTALRIAEDGYEIPLIVTAKETPEYEIGSDDFSELANKLNARFINSGNLNKEYVISEIQECGMLDIAISINYPGIISQKVIDLFSSGILNAHGGDLTRYRGNACQAWAIINREQEIVLCIHKMIGGELDSGDIIERARTGININTKIGEIYKWMENKTPELVLSALKKLNNDPEYILEKQSQNMEDSLRCYPRIPDDGRIDWKMSNEVILRLINASSEPFSGAYCNFDNKKVTILDAEIYVDNENYLAVPGQVSQLLKDDGDIVVICGEGKLKLKEIEINGVRTKPANIIRTIRKRFV
ncbi:MAG: methionyl-tRNA formyltransferase [Thermodesulfobacteriota bacterium]